MSHADSGHHCFCRGVCLRHVGTMFLTMDITRILTCVTVSLTCSTLSFDLVSMKERKFGWHTTNNAPASQELYFRAFFLVHSVCWQRDAYSNVPRNLEARVNHKMAPHLKEGNFSPIILKNHKSGAHFMASYSWQKVLFIAFLLSLAFHFGIY